MQYVELFRLIHIRFQFILFFIIFLNQVDWNVIIQTGDS